MKITELAIKKNMITITLILILILSGISAFFKLPRAEDPGFEVRRAVVVTFYPGASPDKVENLVTDKIEKVLQEIPQLDYIKSESRTGLSIVFVNLYPKYKHLRPIWDSLRRKVQKAEKDLPKGIYGPYVNDEFGDVFGTIITITGEGYNYADIKKVADNMRDEILRFEDVSKVDIYGDQKERVFIDYDNSKLAQYGISPAQLKAILEAQNIILPGGDIRTDNERINIEPSGNFESVDDIKNAIISIPGKSDVVYLKDLANVYRDYIYPPDKKVHSSGIPGLALAISLKDGGDIIRLGKNIKNLVDTAQKVYPHGINFDITVFQPHEVDKKVNEFVKNLREAIMIVIVIMIITLGLRTGLIVATLIPVVVAITFFIMSLLNIGIDQVSLAALIIALGILVDTSIVMSESIIVQMQEGKQAYDAAIDSAKELGFPLFTATIAISSAFLPIYLAQAEVGEYTASIFKVVAISLLTSLTLALTMVPLLCCKFLKVKPSEGHEGYNSKFYKGYRKFLINLLKHPYKTISIMVGLFMLSLFGFKFIPNIFFPPSDRATFMIEIKLPVGSAVEQTEETVTKIENYIKQDLMANLKQKEGITTWTSFIGQGAPRYVISYSPEVESPEYAIMLVNTTSNEINSEIEDKIRNYCFKAFPDVKTIVKPVPLGPPYDSPVEVRISGKDPQKLFKIVEQTKNKLESIHGVTNISDNWGRFTKKLSIKINKEKAFRASMTNQDIAVSLLSSLSGLEVSQYREEDKIIPIELRATKQYRNNFDKLESLNVYVQATGQSVPLKQVATIVPEFQPGKIMRRNKIKTITIQTEVLPGTTPHEVVSQIVPWLEKESKNWEFGYRWGIGGENEESVKANKAIFAKLPIAGILILLLLVIQFNSIKKPLIIILTVPMEIIGVSFGLLINHSYFGFMTLLGVISLAGIVVNNALVLIERITIEIEHHKLPISLAIVEAAQRRLRPIFLTASCTIGGLIPLWLSGGPMWKPMAISIIFGLFFATTLTLGLVPVLYKLFYGADYNDFDYEKIK